MLDNLKHLATGKNRREMRRISFLSSKIHNNLFSFVCIELHIVFVASVCQIVYHLDMVKSKLKAALDTFHNP